MTDGSRGDEDRHAQRDDAGESLRGVECKRFEVGWDDDEHGGQDVGGGIKFGCRIILNLREGPGTAEKRIRVEEVERRSRTRRECKRWM